MSASRRLTARGAVLVALAALTGAPACSSDAPARPAASARRPAAAPEATPSSDAVGVVIAEQLAELAAPFSGVLLRVLVRAGDQVSAGQLLAELDPRPLLEEVRVAEAALQAAEAAHRQAQVDIEDAQRRLAVETTAATAGISPTTNVEEARLAVKRAEAAAQRAAANAAVESARVLTARNRLRDTRLTAPFAGVVAIRYLDAGATLSVGRAVLRLIGTEASGARLRLRFAVEPQLAARLTAGQLVRATIDTVPAPVLASIRQISPAVDPASGLLFVEAELSSDPGEPGKPGGSTALRPGLAATVHLP